MRKLMLSASVAALVIASGSAFAAVRNEQGTITSINPGASLTLDAGKVRTFRLGHTVDTLDLRLGDRVDVTYDMRGKVPVAIAVQNLDIDQHSN
jgi:hypothetical protein